MVKAIVVHEHGGPEALKWEDVEVGDPKPGEARIRHEAIGLNFVDVYYRTGLYKPAGGLPFIPGSEGAGTVVAVGEGVTQREAGRPGQLLRAERLLLRGAAHSRRPPDQGAGGHRLQDRRRHDAERPDRAVPAAPDVSR